MENGKGLLDGVVVLDLGRVLACPYAAVLMADLGATVIKIENPKGGDDTRKMGPFINGNSVYYTNFNRSKVGITLNLKEPEGKEIFKELVKKADVVLENYRPGTMDKLGLGYDVLKEIKPGIVSGALTAFTMSIDDFVISYFTAGSSASTLAMTIYGMTKKRVTPEINAVSTLLFVTVLVLLAIVNIREARQERKRAAELRRS